MGAQYMAVGMAARKGPPAAAVQGRPFSAAI